MNRIALFALLLQLSVVTAYAQTMPLKRYGWDNISNIPLYGDVRRVECVYGYLDCDTGQFEAETYVCNYTYYFNERGDVDTVIYRVEDGNWRYNVVGEYEYSSNGMVMKEPRIIGPLNECFCELIGECYHQYDSNGKKLQTIVKDPNGEMAAIVSYSYDSGGRLIESVVTDSQRNLLYRFDEYKYDENKRLIEEPFYDRTGENEPATGTNSYKYDYNGNIIEKTRSGFWYLLNGPGAYHFEHVYKYRYNSKGFVVEEDNMDYSYRINHGRTITEIYKLWGAPMQGAKRSAVEYIIEYRTATHNYSDKKELGVKDSRPFNFRE